jgi:hypothetical protein
MAVTPATTASAAPSTRTTVTPIGAPLATLSDPAATAEDVFGYSVAVSGKTSVVSALGPNSFAGAAYIYEA